MVGGHDVDGAVEQRIAQCHRVAVLAQWRVDAVHAIIGAQLRISEQQVMRGDLCGDVNPLLFCPTQQ